jgi:FkbM family methyltransferase
MGSISASGKRAGNARDSTTFAQTPAPAMPDTESLQFEYRESVFDTVRDNIKMRLFEKVTRRSTNLFLKGRDKISLYPQLVGLHEATITRLIDHFAASGHADFLLDVGANIGLTSCQNGNSFKRVDMFEPNPLCCNILEVNCRIALSRPEYHVHNFGVGDEDKRCTLMVPRHNWGGAFINDDTNSYDQATLAGKDAFQSINAGNYFPVEIELRKAAPAFAAIFQELTEAGLSNGVVKIDVEGYEPSVLHGLAEAIPPGLKLFIVFESWNANFAIDNVVASFKGRATAYKIEREVAWKKSWPKAFKAASMLLHPRITHRVVANQTHDWSGYVVLHVN